MLDYPDGTLRDMLDAKGVSWKYYAPPYKANTPAALLERVRRHRCRAPRPRMAERIFRCRKRTFQRHYEPASCRRCRG